MDGKKIPVERGVDEKLHGRNALSLSPSFTLNSGRKARISLFFPHQKKKKTLSEHGVCLVSISDYAMPLERDRSTAVQAAFASQDGRTQSGSASLTILWP